MLDEVAGQVPDDDEPSDDEPSSSASGGEKCGVCEIVQKSRTDSDMCWMHKASAQKYCVKYMRLSANLRAGMCNMCCGKVEDLFFGSLRVFDYSRFNMEPRRLVEEVGKVSFKRNRAFLSNVQAV